MLARATFRAASAPTLVARRGFQSTRAQFSSPYHYPEGPRSNLPFDPLKRGFAFKYWGFMGTPRWPATAEYDHALTATATGFGLPFALAGESPSSTTYDFDYVLTMLVLQSGRQRRTSPRRTDRGHKGVFRMTRSYGTCRISRGPSIDCTRHHDQFRCLCLLRRPCSHCSHCSDENWDTNVAYDMAHLHLRIT
jgi:cytochrome c oxidase subunit 7c